jgi:hypothetical protein
MWSRIDGVEVPGFVADHGPDPQRIELRGDEGLEVIGDQPLPDLPDLFDGEAV